MVYLFPAHKPAVTHFGDAVGGDLCLRSRRRVVIGRRRVAIGTRMDEADRAGSEHSLGVTWNVLRL